MTLSASMCETYGAKYTAEQLHAMGWERGTKCEQAVITIFDACDTTLLPHRLLTKLVGEMGHATTTVQRAIIRLLKFRVLKKVAQSHTRLVSRRLPWTPTNASRPGKAANRFEAGKIDAEREASFVRQYLAERLDKAFEYPNCYLADVLKAVEWAGRMATAVLANDPAGLKQATEFYRREWHLKQPNEHFRPLTSARLMEALQVGLFLEEYADDEEVKARIAEHMGKMQKLREAEIAHAVRENERITEENKKREKAGLDPEPLIECDDDWLNRKEFANHSNGLVPKGGGERVGLMRLRGFLIRVGAVTENETAPGHPGA